MAPGTEWMTLFSPHDFCSETEGQGVCCAAAGVISPPSLMSKIPDRNWSSGPENRRRMLRHELATHTIAAAGQRGIESANVVIRFD
jgi:hypothetical protein